MHAAYMSDVHACMIYNTTMNSDTHITGYLYTRVHNISIEGGCLTAYTYFKRTVSSTESAFPDVTR